MCQSALVWFVSHLPESLIFTERLKSPNRICIFNFYNKFAATFGCILYKTLSGFGLKQADVADLI